MRTEQIHPSGPPRPTVAYSRLDPCPRCGEGFAVPDPGWNAPACTLEGCGETRAAPHIDPTADRTSLQAHNEAGEWWLGRMVGDMVVRGYRQADRAHLRQEQEAADAEKRAAGSALHAMGIENPDDPKQILQALEDAGCEFDSRFENKNGRPSTKKMALAVYAEAQPQLRGLTTATVAYRDAMTRGGQIRALAVHRDRIHPTIDSHACESGRMAMKEPNLMGLDRRLRPLLRSDEGHVLVRADFDTVEWRVAAALSDDPCLIGRIEADVDLHSALAVHLFGTNHTSEDRELAKTISFQILYGSGVDGIVKKTGLSRNEAQRVRDGIWSAYSDLGTCARRLQRQTSMLTPYGRRIAGSAEKDYANLNYLVQGAARDLLVDALCWLAHEGRADNIWMLLHDEIILQVPEKDADDAVEALNEAMNLDLLGVPITAAAAVLGTRWR